MAKNRFITTDYGANNADFGEKIAIGYNNSVGGSYNFVFGKNNVLQKDSVNYNLVNGLSNQINRGQYNCVSGEGNQIINGYRGLLVGQNNKSYNGNVSSCIIGTGNNLYASQSFIVGYWNTIKSGPKSCAIGGHNTVESTKTDGYNFAFGHNLKITGDHLFAAGSGNIIKGGGGAAVFGLNNVI